MTDFCWRHFLRFQVEGMIKLSGKEISLVLGTAGHIDHGKTTLIKAITGVDCDSLVEEKKRGITIELGFAPLRLPSEKIVSVIDVPGHEKFIRQMVAGVSGIDAVLLVVAADEGVMPQTREHLDILELLGIHDGFVVLTKADLVDDEMIEMATEDVSELLQGSFLEGKKIIPVSSVTRKNLDTVIDEIERLVSSSHPRSRKGPFFMPIDRAFPVAGFGTVVTGTAYGGKIFPGREVSILPLEKDARIRSVQVHSSMVEEAWAGQRVAMSLTGVSVDDLHRGDVVCEKGLFKKTSCFDTYLKILPSSPEPLTHWQRIRLHIGTSDVLGRVSLLGEKEILPGQVGFAQIVTEEDVVASFSERFIIRFYSPLVTIGGGEVLFPYGRKPRGRTSRIEYLKMLSDLKKAPPNEGKLAAIVLSREMIPVSEASILIQESEQNLLAKLKKMEKQGDVLVTESSPRMIFSRRAIEKYSNEINEILSSFHEEQPYSPGLLPPKLAELIKWNYDIKALKTLLSYLSELSIVSYEDGIVCQYGFTAQDDKFFEENSKKVLDLCIHKGFHFPTIEEISLELNLDNKRFSSFFENLRNMGEVVILQGNFVLHKELQSRFVDLLKDIRQDITIASVRDKTGSSRKFILPVLEYLDSRKITRRVGDKRILLLKNL